MLFVFFFLQVSLLVCSALTPMPMFSLRVLVRPCPTPVTEPWLPAWRAPQSQLAPSISWQEIALSLGLPLSLAFHESVLHPQWDCNLHAFRDIFRHLTVPGTPSVEYCSRPDRGGWWINKNVKPGRSVWARRDVEHFVEGVGAPLISQLGRAGRSMHCSMMLRVVAWNGILGTFSEERLVISGQIFDWHDLVVVLLVSGGWNAGILPNILQCTRRHPPLPSAKNYWAPNVSSADVDKPWRRGLKMELYPFIHLAYPSRGTFALRWCWQWAADMVSWTLHLNPY